MFEGRNDICVPPVVSEQTAERVLTMRFEPVKTKLHLNSSNKQAERAAKNAKLLRVVSCRWIVVVYM